MESSCGEDVVTYHGQACVEEDDLSQRGGREVGVIMAPGHFMSS